MVTPIRAVGLGATVVTRAWRVWLLLWALTLAFAAVLVLPAAAILHADLGHSLYAARMFGNFDPQWTAEFLFKTGNVPLITVPPLAAALVLAYLLLTTFLNGGVLAVFTQSSAFWPGCGRNFWRLLRLFLVSLVCYALVVAANLGLGKIGGRIWGEGMVERPVVIFGWVRAGIIVLLVLVVNMVFDYAKIRAVAQNSTLLRSVAFVGRNFIRTATTYALLCVLAAALAAVYWCASSALPRTALGWLIAVLVVQQVFVVVRVWVRLLFFASQAAVSDQLTAGNG
jgi:hypothetical protein